MSESRAHKRAKYRAAGRGGRVEVRLGSGRRLDALTASGGRATEVETSGDFERLELAVERLVESGARDRALRVPHRHMGLAAAALRKAGVAGRVQNMHNSSGFMVD